MTKKVVESGQLQRKKGNEPLDVISKVRNMYLFVRGKRFAEHTVFSTKMCLDVIG